MQSHQVLRVRVICSDVFSKSSIESLIMRDPRTIIPDSTRKIDLVLIYEGAQSLEIASVREKYPQSKIVIMVGYCTESQIQDWLEEGVSGVFRRDDVQVALVPYLVRIKGLLPDEYALSESLAVYQGRNYQCGLVSIPAWKPCEALSERLIETLELRLVKGLSSVMTADAMGIQPGSVDRHLSNAYAEIFYNPLINEEDFVGIDLDSYTKEIQGFLWYTALPECKRICVSV